MCERIATRLVVLTLLSVSAGLSPASAWSQVEVEPNHPCPDAQRFGVVVLPFSVSGELDSSVEPDVDFFRVRGTPGTRVRIDLDGQESLDAYLGAFDSDCNSLAQDDDSGGSVDSRIDIDYPANGTLILGVTECCDSGFSGGGNGPYVLSVQESTSVSVDGRIVDGETGLGLPGSSPSEARVELRFCHDVDCDSYDYLGTFYTDDGGSFEIASNDFGDPLDPGSYQLLAIANPYEEVFVGPFDVAPSEAYHAGDIALAPIPQIAGVRGRLVDAVTGEPLADLVDYASVDLYRCVDFCDWVGSTNVDDDSRFVFTEDYAGVPLLAGPYEIHASADQYRNEESEQFDVAEGEDYNAGDVALHALTVAFSDIVPCKTVPREGGTCRFSVRITNTLSNGLFGGKAWAVVDGSNIGSVLDSTTFQLSHQGRIWLQPAESKIVEFAFRVPTTVDEGAYLCVRAYAGEATPNTYFGTVGTEELFCVEKSYGPNLELMSPPATRAAFERLHGRTRTPGRPR